MTPLQKYDSIGVKVRGDADVAPHARLPSGLECDGSARLHEGARVNVDVIAAGTVSAAAGVEVAGHVRARGGVEWHPRASAGALTSDGPLRIGDRVVAERVEARSGVGASTPRRVTP